MLDRRRLKLEERVERIASRDADRRHADPFGGPLRYHQRILGQRQLEGLRKREQVLLRVYVACRVPHGAALHGRLNARGQPDDLVVARSIPRRRRPRT